MLIWKNLQGVLGSRGKCQNTEFSSLFKLPESGTFHKGNEEVKRSDQITKIDFLNRALKCGNGTEIPEGCAMAGFCMEKGYVLLVLALAVWVCLLLETCPRHDVRGVYVLSFRQDSGHFRTGILLGRKCLWPNSIVTVRA